MTEDREFTRVPMRIEVHLSSAEGVVKTLKTKDLSIKGVFVEAEEQWPESTECDVSLTLQAAEPIIIEFKGKVERSLKTGMGIEFLEMSLESYEHLQQLLRYNSTETDKIDSEIKTHVGLKKKV
jgi:orotate phosphoribosyltransferase